MTRTIKTAAAALASAAVLAIPAAQAWEPGEDISLRMAASQPVHAIYPISAGVKAIVERELPGVVIDMTVTQGGVENARLLQVGEVEMANGNTLGAYSVHHGAFAADGADPFPGLVALLPSYTWEIGTMVPVDSEVETFRDLVGQRIGMGPLGSGAEATASQALAAMGLSDDDFARVQRSAPAQAFGSLAAGTVDAVIWGTAHPSGAIVEQLATRGLRFVSFSEDDMAAVVAEYPYFHFGYVDPALYDGIDEQALWVGGGTHFWVNADIDETLVYEIVRVVWENRAELEDRHPSQERLNDDLVRMQAELLPMHPGADRYFREIGVLD